MEIKIKESSWIKPEKETPNHNIRLSNLDLSYGIKFCAPYVFFYKPNGCSNFFEIGVLKEALGKALVTLYPMAGRFSRDENGRFQINCNGEGVLFVVAETDSTLEGLDDTGTLTVEQRQMFIPTLDYSSDLTSIPFLVIQVTKFACGGVSLGVERSHTVTDGHGGIDFLRTWANIARGTTIDISPYFDRSILLNQLPPNQKFHHIEYDLPPSMNISNQNSKNQSTLSTTTVETFKLTPFQMESMKAKTKNKYSIYKILTAHIWRCVCMARNLSNDQETKLFIPVNGRSRFNISFLYFGNAIFLATQIALAGDLLSESITDTIERIDKAIKRMNCEYLKSAIVYLEQMNDLKPIFLTPNITACPNLMVLDWTRIPFSEIDFGWGKAMHMKGVTPREGSAILTLNDDGSLLLRICLNTHHMQSFVNLFNTELATY